MKAMIRTIIGLIFDDWWLAGGILISIFIAYFSIQIGFNVQLTGWLLLILIVGILTLSLRKEYLKKIK